MESDGTKDVRQGLLLLLAAAGVAAGILIASGHAWAQGSAAVARPARAPRPAPATPLEMALRLERELARGAGMLMPDPERPVRLDGGLIPLDGSRSGFPAAFLDGLAPGTRNGVDVWSAVLHVDDANGDMLFHNAAGELFWTVPAAAGNWSADWIARLHTPDGRASDFFTTEQRYQELLARPARTEVPDRVLRRSAWFNTRQYFRPSRVEMTFTFILQDDLADYRSAAASSRSQASGGASQRSPAALTELSLTGIACGTNGVTLSAAWPTNTVISGEALDIFFSRSLLPQAWTNRWWAAVEPAAGGVDITIPQSDLPPVPDAPAPACFTNTAPSAYDPGVIYTNIVCTNAVRPAVSGFFRLADLADSDSDGLTDAAETWTHGTNPGLADTDNDGDGYPLWQELFYGTSDEVPGDVAQILTNGSRTVTFTSSAPYYFLGVLRIGDHPIPLGWRQAFSFDLPGGSSIPITLTNSYNCSVSITSTNCIVLAGGSGGGLAVGGTGDGTATLVLPVVNIGSGGTVCLHEADQMITAGVTPPLPGTYDWQWDGGGINGTGRAIPSTGIPSGGLTVLFRPDGGNGVCCAHTTEIYQCQRIYCPHGLPAWLCDLCTTGGSVEWCVEHGQWKCVCPCISMGGGGMLAPGAAASGRIGSEGDSCQHYHSHHYRCCPCVEHWHLGAWYAEEKTNIVIEVAHLDVYSDDGPVGPGRSSPARHQSRSLPRGSARASATPGSSPATSCTGHTRRPRPGRWRPSPSMPMAMRSDTTRSAAVPTASRMCG